MRIPLVRAGDPRWGTPLFYRGSAKCLLSGDNALRMYRLADALTPLDEVSIPLPGTIIALDTADLDHDNVPELYVSILDRGTFTSSVFDVVDGKLKEIATDLEWAFRGVGMELESRTVYAQKLGTDGQFHGDVAVLSNSGIHFDAKQFIALPQFGHVLKFKGAQ